MHESPNRLKRRLAITALLAAVWLAIVFFAVPWLIRSAYAGESLSIFNRMISGQGRTTVDRYLEMWRGIAIRSTATVLAAVAVTFAIRGIVRGMRRVHSERLYASPPRSAALDTLQFAVFTGIVAGIAEAVNGIVRHRVQHMPTGEVVSGELFWLAPLAAVTTFVLIGLVLIALDRLLGGRFDLLRFAPAIFTGLAVYSLIRALGMGFANVATMILAAGIAVAAYRGARSAPAAVRWMVRTSTAWLVAILLAWAGVLPLARRLVEARVIAGLPAPAAAAPNVLVIIWDTARALSLSLYGYGRETTPELERLAERGATFERAFATASWSLPSHASIFTGRYPQEMTVGRRIPLDDTHATLAEALASKGYATGGFTANLFYGSADYGIARGFAWYDARPGLRPMVAGHTWWLSRTLLSEIREALGNRQHMLRRRAGYVNASFLEWLDRHTDRPFLAVLNYFDVHEPYLPPEPFNLAFSEKQPRYWFTEEQPMLPDDALAELRDAYDGSIRYADFELGRLLERLEATGRLDNTIVIVTADHGEDFGEHGADVFGHARSVYATSLLVPLVVVYPPRVPRGVRVRDAVSIRDIPATVMDALDLEEENPFPGISLVRYANGTVTPPERAQPRLSSAEKHPWADPEEDHWPAAIGNLFSLATSDVHYIVDGRGDEHLFDLSSDILEQNDLAAEPSHESTIERFRAVLDSMVMTKDGTRRIRVPRWK